jgi:hypothetical protein
MMRSTRSSVASKPKKPNMTVEEQFRAAERDARMEAFEQQHLAQKAFEKKVGKQKAVEQQALEDQALGQPALEEQLPE